jgi:hypothetical protein
MCAALLCTCRGRLRTSRANRAMAGSSSHSDNPYRAHQSGRA